MYEALVHWSKDAGRTGFGAIYTDVAEEASALGECDGNGIVVYETNIRRRRDGKTTSDLYVACYCFDYDAQLNEDSSVVVDAPKMRTVMLTGERLKALSPWPLDPVLVSILPKQIPAAMCMKCQHAGSFK